MKGIIFLKLEEFVDETFGELAWDKALLNTDLKSEGAYTSIAFYEDEEFFALISTLCAQHSTSLNEAQFAFGQWIFSKLLEIAPHDMHGYTDTFAFLKAVDSIIHQEVKKIHKDAILPKFKFMEESEHFLRMEYISPRGLDDFCLGIIDSLIKHLGQKIKVKKIQGANQETTNCVFELIKQQ